MVLVKGGAIGSDAALFLCPMPPGRAKAALIVCRALHLPGTGFVIVRFDSALSPSSDIVNRTRPLLCHSFRGLEFS